MMCVNNPQTDKDGYLNLDFILVILLLENQTGRAVLKIKQLLLIFAIQLFLV